MAMLAPPRVSDSRLAQFFRISLLATLAAVAGFSTLWGTLALWYRLPAPGWLRAALAGCFLLAGLTAAAALFGPHRVRIVLAYLIALGAVLAWWTTLRPPSQADFAPDVARQVTGIVEGDRLTLTNVRDFDWHSETDVTERWTTRSYDLAGIETLDLFMSYWAGPQMAHVILSFGFADGEHLAWSVEVRRLSGGAFAPVADLFKSNALVIVAARERDVLGVRTNVRGEDVQLYRLKTPPGAARRLLLEYVRDANELAATPRFYNSLTTNCTSVVLKMMRAVGAVLPFDWRLVLNGHLPAYAYEHGGLDSRLDLATLRRRSHVAPAAIAAGLGEGFSQAIRVDVPDPRAPMP